MGLAKCLGSFPALLSYVSMFLHAVNIHEGLMPGPAHGSSACLLYIERPGGTEFTWDFGISRGTLLLDA